MTGEPGQHDPRGDPLTPGAAEGSGEDLPLVPLFPLPNVVLFPRAVLPLHIFEDRYRAMTRHAIEGDGRIAMALLRPGWEKSYYGRPAIEPVVCVGSILSHEQLPDGKYNFLLQGAMRARVVAEVGHDPYRLARVRPLVEVPAPPEEMKGQRRRLVDLFTRPPLAGTGMGWQFARLLSTPLPTPDVADLTAYTFLDDAPLKQSLLAEPDVSRRVARVLDALEAACTAAPPAPSAATAAEPAAPSAVPTPVASAARYRNPSLN